MSELGSFPALNFSPPSITAEPLSPASHSTSSLSCSSSSLPPSPLHSSPARPPHQPLSQPTAARASAAQHSQPAEEQPRDTGGGGRPVGRKRARALPDDESDHAQPEQQPHPDDSFTGATLAAFGRRWDEVLRHKRRLEEENARLRLRVQQLEQRRTDGDDEQQFTGSQRQQDGPQPPPAASISLRPHTVSAAAPSRSQHSDHGRAGDARHVEHKAEDEQRQNDHKSASQDSSEAVFRILLGDGRPAHVNGKQYKTSTRSQPASADKSDTTAASVESHISEPTLSASTARRMTDESKADQAPLPPSISAADRLLLEMDEDERHQDVDAIEPYSKATSRSERKQRHGDDPFATQAMSQQPPPQPTQPTPQLQPQQHIPANEEYVRHRLAAARQERKQANELYSNNQLQQAIEHYNSADSILAALPATEAVNNELHLLLASRAPVFIKLPEPVLALADAERLTAVKPQWWKSFALKARSLAALHRFDEAHAAFEAGLQCDLNGDERSKLLEKKADFERKWQRFSADTERRATALKSTHSTTATARTPPASPIPSSATSTTSASTSASSSTSNRTAMSSSSTEATTNTARIALPPSSFDAYYSHPPLQAPQDAMRLSPLHEQTEDDQMPQPPHSPILSTPLPPTPTKQSAQPYALIPRVTMEGLRDLLGDDGLIMSEEWVEAVHAIKVRREADNAQTGAAVVLVQAKCKPQHPHDRWGHKRRRTAATADGDAGGGETESGVDHDSRSLSLLDVHIRFDANRVTEWSCACYQPHTDQVPHSTQPPNDTADESLADAPTTASTHTESQRAAQWNHELIPCKHVGATLLLVRKKQATNSTTPPSSSPAATLFVHPSHALPAAVNAALSTLASEYASMTVSQLRQLLQLNADKVTGVKEELVQRCVEGRVRGVLPACDRCGGRRYYANGYVHCRGKFDVDRKRREPCLLYWPEQAVLRRPWRE